jgi:Outer membrane protein Omp28/Secretion system C-terminal sorting domain
MAQSCKKVAIFAGKITFPMIKNLSLLVAGLLLASIAVAQQLPKRYVLIEHFTNSRCGICAGSNPGFYTQIASNAASIHHVSIHPSFPYAQCIFYQYNTADNMERATLYAVPGTPRVVLNGKAPQSLPLSAKVLSDEIARTSPISIKVTDEVTATGFKTNISVTTHAALPAANYRFFAMLVEKRIDYNAPNGERVHYDVLRDILTASTGAIFTGTAAGAKTEYSYSASPLPEGTKADQLYVLAFVQDMNGQEVLNSGTRFDPPLTTGVTEPTASRITVAPNPVTSVAQIALPDGDRATAVDIFNLEGQRVVLEVITGVNNVEFSVETLPAGVYVAKITGEKGVYTGKFVKE